MEPEKTDTAPAEGKYQKIERCLGRFVWKLAVWLVICLPIAFILVEVIGTLHFYRYPKITLWTILFFCLALLPTVCVLITRKLKLKRVTKSIIGKLCALYLPISFFCSCLCLGGSETTDFRYYRQLDAQCLANRSEVFQALFPTWPHCFISEAQPNGDIETVYLDAHYYYRNLPALDYTYDIYAEWPLEQEKFESEITRVTGLFETKAAEHPYYKYVTMQKGAYTCLFYYRGDAPFETVRDSYTYYIFAYDPQTNKVRYIMCDSLENGADQPYYLELDWEYRK